MKVLVTGARGFLGWRSATLLAERGHEVIAVARPGSARRGAAEDLEVVALDAGDPQVRGLLAGCDGVLHFAGVPDPARARDDPAGAVRENAGTTLNLLEGCEEHGVGLVYPSTVRAALDPPPDAYALSKRLGELSCDLHRAPSVTLRLPSVYGPGQVAWEGATGAVAIFAARALQGSPLVIYGNPTRERDFVYVDDVVLAIERLISQGRWNEVLSVTSGAATSLLRAAELVREVVGSDSPIETPGGDLPPGEDLSYSPSVAPRLDFQPHSLEEGVRLYVEWLRGHPAAKSSP